MKEPLRGIRIRTVPETAPFAPLIEQALLTVYYVFHIAGNGFYTTLVTTLEDSNRTLVGHPAGGPRTDRTWRRASLTSIPPVLHKDAWTDVARAPLWWQLPGDPWEPPPPPQPPAPPTPPPPPPPAAPVLRPRPRPVLGCHRSEGTPAPSPMPARSPLCWQWGYRWPRHWEPQPDPRTPIPPAGTYSGPRIAYDSAALLKLRDSPLSQKPPKDLASFPNDIVKGINTSSSEETLTGSHSPSPPIQQ